jgi:hypothetical protein
MKERHSKQYTVREVSESVDLRLRETAALEDISLNQATLRALARGLGLSDEPVRYRSLRGIVKPGDKVDTKGWAKALGAMDTVNPEDWK